MTSQLVVTWCRYQSTKGKTPTNPTSTATFIHALSRIQNQALAKDATEYPEKNHRLTLSHWQLTNFEQDSRLGIGKRCHGVPRKKHRLTQSHKHRLTLSHWELTNFGQDSRLGIGKRFHGVPRKKHRLTLSHKHRLTLSHWQLEPDISLEPDLNIKGTHKTTCRYS